MDPKVAKAAQESAGIPKGLKVFSPAPFGGINAKDSPPAIGDSDFVWTENFLSLGSNKFRTVGDIGASDFNAGHLTIIYADQYTRGTAYYRAIFFSDGSAVEYNMATAGTVALGPAGTFYVAGGLLPACTQWGTQYLLICNRNTVNDYWIWDGTLLYKSGGAAPNGVALRATGGGYNSPPTITAYGGLGSGMTFTPYVNAGGIVNVRITNPGVNYEVGDTVQLAFIGGGSDTTPILESFLNAGSVSAINVTSGGSGYTAATVSITGGGGSGATGTAIISRQVGSISVTAPGSGYTVADVLIEGGGGSGATAQADINNGVSSYTVVSGGSNYTTANVIVSGGGGTGASAAAVITGGIGAVNVLSQGSGYTSPPTVAITGGGGSGATAAAVLTGVVGSLTLGAGGSGYASPPAVVLSGGGGSGATGSASITGSVSYATVLTGGGGYTSTPTVGFSGGGGSGATATAILSGGVNSITIGAGGTGYTSPPVVVISGGGGSGASATATVSGGAVTSVVITTSGTGYSSDPAVSFVGTGSGATATSEISGVVVSVTVTAAGSGYTSNPTIAITGGGGAGAAAAAVLSASVTSVTLTGGGTGYVSPPSATFSGGGGSGATAVTTISGGVGSVVVTNSGAGYNSQPTITFSGGAGSNAAANATIKGSITSIGVVSAGTGYSSPPAVTITGDGTGATATATLQTGAISAIRLLTAGSGYTSTPTITITGDGVGATAAAVMLAGVVSGITITDGGSGYTTSPAVAISGDGTGATAVAILSATGVGGVMVTNGGTGFVYAPTVTFEGGGGVGASGIAVLSPTPIDRINVISGGTGYFVAPTVTLIGPTGEIEGAAVANVSNGIVTSVTVTNAGSYTGNVEVVFRPVIRKADTLPPGTGAAATVTLKKTSIASVTMSNFGTNYTAPPAILVTPGANNSAYATVGLMPYGVSGSCLETFQQRVWIADPDSQPYATAPSEGNFQVSAPGSLTDFATSDGGVQFTNSDSFLQTRYNAIKQSNGYLYFFGDGSVSVVSGVTTSGSPATTSFNYQPIELQEGLSFRDAISDFGKSILYMNQTGIYGLYGGSSVNVSEQLQDIFDNAIFPPVAGAVTPSSATVTIHSVKWTLRLMTVQDPDTLLYRTVMLAWNEKTWHVLSQSVTFTYIWSQKVGSLFKAFGTDGKNIYPLFVSPSTSLVKRFTTKVFGGGGDAILLKELYAFYAQGQDHSAGNTGINLTVDYVFSGQVQQSAYDPSDSNAIIPGATDFGGETFLIQQPDFKAANPYWPIFGTGTIGGKFVMVQARVSTTSPDFTLSNLVLSYSNAGMIG